VVQCPAVHNGRPGTGGGGVRRRSDRGGAAVEAAFVLPILLLVIFGLIDIGRMLNAQINVTEAAREGARVVSVGGDPSARVAQIAGPDAQTAPVACPVADAVGNDAQVTVTYPFEFVTPLGALAGVFGSAGPAGEVTLTGHGVMPCQ
jgi:hypothetical protein